MEVNSLSFLTVTYWNDFDLLDQQIKSMDQYFTTRSTHYIVLNDDIKHLDELTTIVAQYKQHNYRIIHCDEIYASYNYSSPSNQTGWVNQQALKLLAYTFIDTEFYCVLDSKNALISNMDKSTFVKNGQPVMVHEHECNINGEFSKYYTNAYAFLKVDQNDATLIQSLTPSVLKRKWVKELLEHIKSKGLTLFNLIIDDNSLPYMVEFYLYSAWIEKHKLTDQIIWYPDSSWVDIERSKNLRRL